MLRTLMILALAMAPLLQAAARPQGEFPPAIVELTIPSEAARMPALAYLAAGQGPHPTLLLLHGYPGNEKNLDLAQALRRAGWNVVFFHYRGAWGSEGEFSFRGAEADVQAVLAYLRQPAQAESLRVDTARIATAGHSMGGHMAVAGILDNPAVRCAVSIDGANLGFNNGEVFNNPEAIAMWREYGDSLFMLAGWSGKKSLEEITTYAEELDLIRRSQQIEGRPVLFIAANSEVIPIARQIEPLVEALRATPDSDIRYQLIEDDHAFSASRLALIDTVEQFLADACVR